MTFFQKNLRDFYFFKKKKPLPESIVDPFNFFKKTIMAAPKKVRMRYPAASFVIAAYVDSRLTHREGGLRALPAVLFTIPSRSYSFNLSG
jgi:hypothetical protein